MSELLTYVPALERSDLLAEPVEKALTHLDRSVAEHIEVAEIDPRLADTAAFCVNYGWSLGNSANCVVIAGRRGEVVRLAACVVLATTRADINGMARKLLDARKASFASMNDAVEATSMEYGGITPLGLPIEWSVYVDSAVWACERVVIGSGLRRSKLFLPGWVFQEVALFTVVDGLAK